MAAPSKCNDSLNAGPCDQSKMAAPRQGRKASLCPLSEYFTTPISTLSSHPNTYPQHFCPRGHHCVAAVYATPHDASPY